MNGERAQGNSRGSLKLWAAVIGFSLAFLIYGLIIFFMIGEKGPPDWDFGVVSDVPGQSEFSTSTNQLGRSARPERQHVAERTGAAAHPTQERLK